MYQHPLHISHYINLIMKTQPYKSLNIQSDISASPFVSAYVATPVRPVLECTPEEDRTDQSFRDECDINFIMKQYEEIGVIDHLNRLTPQWEDVPDFDFREAMEMVREAREKFACLPATLRERFSNDPHVFMQFFTREENRAEGERLGLLVPRPVAPVPPANPEPPKAA